MTVAHATLMQVAARAIHDEAFFNALMKNIDKALADAGWTLEGSDLEKLRKALQSPPAYAKFDLPRFLKLLHQKGFIEIEWTAIEWIDINKLNKP
jgi:hypothetical protein